MHRAMISTGVAMIRQSTEMITGIGQRKASMPVSCEPSTRVCTSCVPSYV